MSVPFLIICRKLPALILSLQMQQCQQSGAFFQAGILPLTGITFSNNGCSKHPFCKGYSVCYFIDRQKHRQRERGSRVKISVDKGDKKMAVAYVIASMGISIAFNASLIAKEHSYTK
jgi:hypothetical protein